MLPNQDTFEEYGTAYSYPDQKDHWMHRRIRRHRHHMHLSEPRNRIRTAIDRMSHWIFPDLMRRAQYLEVRGESLVASFLEELGKLRVRQEAPALPHRQEDRGERNALREVWNRTTRATPRQKPPRPSLKHATEEPLQRARMVHHS